MLTQKQENFVQELLKGKSQRQAYKNAFNAKNMSDKTIDHKASVLFCRDDIRARYKELNKELSDRMIDSAEDIRQMIVQKEKAILNANLGDVYELSSDGNGYPTAVANVDRLSEFDMSAVQEISYDSKGRLKIKLFDKQAAIKNLMDLYGIASAEEKKDDIHIILHNAEGYDV